MKLPKIIWSVNFVTIVKLFKKYILGKKDHTINFGLKPDKWDSRDIYYKLSRRPGAIYPASTYRKNISEFPIRYDQGDIGSCVGNGVVEAFRRTVHVNKMADANLSRLFAYYISRDEEEKNSDSGASIRNAFKAVNKWGICHEETWPYIPSKYAVTPPETAFAEAMEHQSIRYERIYPVTKEAIMDAVSRGFPVVYGKILYESFMSSAVAKTGIVPKPRTCREDKIGGHCMVIFDYDEAGTVELNSWGRNWGLDGTCHVPWEYVLNCKLCQDFWVFYETE